MAKSGKPTPKPQVSKPKTPTAPPPATKAETPPRDWISRPPADSPADPLLRKAFIGAAAAALLLMLWLALGSGVNADDKFQVDYSKKLVEYYGTFGRDTAALRIPDGNMHLYGGFFEVVTGFSNKALGFQDSQEAYHHVRHLWSAFFGWVAILCAALLARLIAGWRAGLITLILLVLSPRFVGDSLMNPKDIPFAAGYMMALYNLVAVLNRMPKPGRWHLAGLAGGLAIALATRAGGLLPFAMLFMFGGLHFLLKTGGYSAFFQPKMLGRYLAVVVGAALAGYVLAVLFWPYAMQNPFQNPLDALSKFADLEVKIRVLFEGANMMSDKTPWHYPVKWILYTIPLAVIGGFLGSLVFLLRRSRIYLLVWIICAAISFFSPVMAAIGFFLSLVLSPFMLKNEAELWGMLLFFAAVFPVYYVIFQDSVIHDGWRHLTFVYPPLAVLAGLFWNELANIFSTKKALQYAVFGVMGLLMADSAWFIAANRQYPYVYFNQLTGGIKGAFGQYELDYWGVSTRQGIEWLEQEGILKPGMTDTVTIATNMHFSAKPFVSKYGDKVRLRYLKWDRRCDEVWDYALYPTRFIDGAALQRGNWPPTNTVHTVEANGTPVLAVLKDSDGHDCYEAVKATKSGDWPAAIDYYNKVVAAVPNNELAWAGLGQAYLTVDSLELSKAAAEQALALNPDDMQGNNVVGLYWIKKGDAAKAKSQFELAVKRDPSNAAAWYYLALFARDEGSNQAALTMLRNAINAAPTFRQAYELSAEIHEATGNPRAAQQFRAALQQMK